MKRIICLLLALTLLFSLSGCEKPDPVPTTELTTQPPTQPSTGVPATEGTAAPDRFRAPGSYQERYSSGKNSDSWMDYYLHIPEGATENMPLVIFLHGDGEIGLIENLENYGLIESAREIYGEAFPFISLSPCTRTNSWIREDISELLKALIDTVVQDYAIDRRRIIITGHSRGAIGTWDMISRYGDFFSAAVPVSCNNENPLDLEKAAKVPVWAFAGDQGQLERNYADAMGEAVDALSAAGGSARMMVLEDMTHIDTDTGAYTEEVFQWMLSFGAAEQMPETEPTLPPETVPVETAPPETVPPETEPVIMHPLEIEAGTHKLTHSSSFYGSSMDYCLFVPERAEEDMPLIVYLHGDGEVGRMNEVADIEIVKQAKEIYGEAFPFLILAPNTSRPDWTPTWTFNMVFDLIETVADTYKVDPEKIILTGHSRGAIGVWYYINMNYYYESFETDIAFSCAVPVSHYAAYAINGELSAKLPILAFCGDSETECQEKLQKNVDTVNAAGGTAKLTVLEGATHADTEKTAYTKDTFEWMLTQ